MHMKGLHHMIRARGGITTLTGVFLRIVLWADLCFSNLQGRQAHFLRQGFPAVSTPEIPILPSPTNGIYLTLPPGLDKIFNTLRHLTHILSPGRIKYADRMEASTMIYNVEYDILLHNLPDDTRLNTSPNPLNSTPNTSADPILHPLIIAAHIYLYISIREIPPTSPAISLMLSRLRYSLSNAPQKQNPSSDPTPWSKETVDYTTLTGESTTVEYTTCRLWSLFIGHLTSSQTPQRYWFTTEMHKTLDALGIDIISGLEFELKKVLWREDFMRAGLVGVWSEMSELGLG
jgi:hypothetical protein